MPKKKRTSPHLFWNSKANQSAPTFTVKQLRKLQNFALPISKTPLLTPLWLSTKLPAYATNEYELKYLNRRESQKGK